MRVIEYKKLIFCRGIQSKHLMQAQLRTLSVDIKRHKKALKKQLAIKQNIKQFVARYGDLIDGPDGIFGVVCDDVLFHMMTFWPPKTIYNPPGRRFLALRGVVLRHLTRGKIDPLIRSQFIKYVFPSEEMLDYCLINDNNRHIINIYENRVQILFTMLEKHHEYVSHDDGTVQIRINEHDRKIGISHTSKGELIIYTKSITLLINKDLQVCILEPDGTIADTNGMFDRKCQNIFKPMQIFKPSFL